MDGTFINHSAAALRELKSIVHFDNGGIGPQTMAKESSGAMKTHADRTIADALACILPVKVSRNKKTISRTGQRFQKVNEHKVKTSLALGKERFNFNA